MWTRLNEITTLIEDCPHSTAKDEGSGYPLIRTPNVGVGRLLLEGVHRVSKDVYDKRNIRAIPQEGDIIYAREAPAGNAATIQKGEIVCLGQRTVLIRPLKGFVDSLLLTYFINAPLSRKSLISKAVGSTAAHVNMEVIRPFWIPLPPLQEQIRIVKEVERLFTIINSIEIEQIELENKISMMKSRVLELAISGKLVPQDPADEPADELLLRINPSTKAADKSHYNGQNLPNGWIQCKFSDLFNVRSARRVHKADWRSEGIPFYRAREIGKLSDLGTVDNDLYIDNLLYSEFAKSGVPQSGDIMITAVGTLGKTYIVRKGDKFYYKDGSVLCIENRNGIDPRYIEMFISSSHFKEQYIWESQGTTVATLTMDRINSYSFVLPPLNEQKRIVSKVDELFAVIDQIKQSLE